MVKRFGRLDILVNDAAYNKSIPFTDLDGLTYEEWNKIIAINLTGPMLLTKAVGPGHEGARAKAASSTSPRSRGWARPAPRSPMPSRRRGSST